MASNRGFLCIFTLLNDCFVLSHYWKIRTEGLSFCLACVGLESISPTWDRISQIPLVMIRRWYWSHGILNISTVSLDTEMLETKYSIHLPGQESWLVSFKRRLYSRPDLIDAGHPNYMLVFGSHLIVLAKLPVEWTEQQNWLHSVTVLSN